MKMLFVLVLVYHDVIGSELLFMRREKKGKKKSKDNTCAIFWLQAAAFDSTHFIVCGTGG